MNWKINYWTLLCFVMVGGLIFSCMDNSKKEKAPTTMEEKKEESPLSKLETIAGCPTDPDTIAAKEAWKRINLYNTTMHTIRTTLAGKIPNLPVNFGEIVKPGQGYLKLPKCELVKMIEKIPSPDKHVYIYLTMQDVPQGKKGETMISAVIAEKADDITDGQLAKNAAQGYYFDFIQPCPPMCQD